MGIPAAGEVVLIPFPFSDLSETRLRPAICLAAAGRGDWILCQVTSNAFGDPLAVAVDLADFAAGGLRVTSYARPGKLFTANGDLIIRSLGILKVEPFDRLREIVASLFRPASPTT